MTGPNQAMQARLSRYTFLRNIVGRSKFEPGHGRKAVADLVSLGLEKQL
jgi:hypothetical protein